MKRYWKMLIPATLLFVLGLAMLIYTFAFAPDSDITPKETAQAKKMFAGIEQRGSVLGDKKSDEAIIVFADLQCTFCAQFSKEALPYLLQEVRRGDLRLDLRLLSVLGQDSLKAAQAAQALASQNKMWQFTELFYLNQGNEGTGYVTDTFIQELYNAIGVNQDLVKASQTEAKRRVKLDDELALRSGIRGTPAFIFVTREGTIRPLAFPNFSKEGITEALEKVRAK